MAELYCISALELNQNLQDQAMEMLQTVADNFQHPVFPCALIAGDVVLLHLLQRLNLIGSEADGKVQARTSSPLGHAQDIKMVRGRTGRSLQVSGMMMQLVSDNVDLHLWQLAH